jgi:hypothetical protein
VLVDAPCSSDRHLAHALQQLAQWSQTHVSQAAALQVCAIDVVTAAAAAAAAADDNDDVYVASERALCRLASSASVLQAKLLASAIRCAATGARVV